MERFDGLLFAAPDSCRRRPKADPPVVQSFEDGSENSRFAGPPADHLPAKAPGMTGLAVLDQRVEPVHRVHLDGAAV